MATAKLHGGVQPSHESQLASPASSANSATYLLPCTPDRQTAPIRILARRYQLTYGGYKYLEIGINVWLPTPAVEIAIGDNRRNEIVLDYEDWDFCLRQRLVLSAFLRDQKKHSCEVTSMMSPVKNKAISLRVARFGDQLVLHIHSPRALISMTSPTVRYMFALAPCVARTVESLNKEMGGVCESLRNMHRIAAATPNTASISSRIRESTVFSPNSIVDCELLAVLYERM